MSLREPLLAEIFVHSTHDGVMEANAEYLGYSIVVRTLWSHSSEAWRAAVTIFAPTRDGGEHRLCALPSTLHALMSESISSGVDQARAWVDAAVKSQDAREHRAALA